MFTSNQVEEEKACCPFNKSHTFAKEKLIFHLNRCKDKQKVMHLYAVCQYNSMHFILKEDYQTHDLICSDKNQIKKLTALLKRNFQQVQRQRERSRDKIKKEEFQEKQEKMENQEHTSQDQELVLSDCDSCLELLKELSLEVEEIPKLKKYLAKYDEINKSSKNKEKSYSNPKR